MVPNHAHADTPMVALRSDEMFRRKGNLKRSYSLDSSRICEYIHVIYTYMYTFTIATEKSRCQYCSLLVTS